MRIGILTFHAQQNYGGVLQCWALKEYLQQLGHETVILDRWITPDNRLLFGPLGVASGFRFWRSVFVRSLCGCGTWKAVVRSVRTIRFVKRLGLTKSHFFRWEDAPADLQIDCLLVGSDQVWHVGPWSDPRPYLLEGFAKEKIIKIAYAASFGMSAVPLEYEAYYRRGFSRFSAISCREKEGVKICRQFGFRAEHVADPTLLLSRQAWNRLLPYRKAARLGGRQVLVCYFMSVDCDMALPCLARFARENRCRVKVLTESPRLKPFKKSMASILANYREMYPRVQICSDYGPTEFVRAFAGASAVLTDSFHAVMFSAVFGKNVRVLRPSTELRRAMFARISEFIESYMTGPVFADSVLDALDSLASGKNSSFCQKKIDAFRRRSRAWLVDALGGVK